MPRTLQIILDRPKLLLRLLDFKTILNQILVSLTPLT